MAKNGCDIIGESVKNGGNSANFIFDIDNNLYDQKDIFEGASRKIFGDGDELPIETLFVRSRVRSDEVFAMVEAGELPPEKMYAYRGCKPFEDCGATLSDDRAMAFQEAYARNQANMQLLPGIIRILDWLKAGGGGYGDYHQWPRTTPAPEN
ncbi:hypothetical protein [Eubacterium aggregans]|uniref:hypothetical protein n=1 Tax=Eubacterium aggregans TaxID=81409 RepID=UPI003F36223F